MKKIDNELTAIVENARRVNSHTSKANFCEECGKEIFVQTDKFCGKRCKNISISRKNPTGFVSEIIPPRYVNASLEDMPERQVRIEKAIAGEWDGFFIFGDVGRGKTHIAAAIAKAYLPNTFKQDGSCGIVWRLTPKLLSEIKAGWKTGNDDFKKYEECKLLILDDFGAEQTTDWSLTTLYTIIATRIDYCRKTIVTSNFTLDRIAEIEPRIASRLSSPDFLKIELKGEDRRVKR